MRATFPPHPPNVGLIPWLLAVAILIVAGCQTIPPEPEHDRAEATEPDTALPVRAVRVPRIAQRTLPDSPPGDLWADIRASFALDHAVDHRRVQQELRWLRTHPSYLTRLRDRLQRYLPYIHAEVTARNLPGELSLLPILESGLDPNAAARGGATGMWQFVPATATRFGLPRDRWIDARRDPVMSTNAALDYLEHLHEDFQDWHMVLAAYNLGEGTVRRAAERHRADTFWALPLPQSSAGYVPRLMALAAIVADPEQYGMQLPPLTNEVPFITIETEGPFDLVRAAAALGVEVDALYGWNPALNQWATPPQGPHQLHVPAALAETAQESLSAVPPEERVQGLREGGTKPHIDHHVVRAGESLWGIASARGLKLAALIEANELGPDHTLQVGQRLAIPPAGATATRVSGHPGDVRRVRYGVRRGDSLARIASRFKVAVDDIIEWNQLDVNSYLQPGQRLLILAPNTGE